VNICSNAAAPGGARSLRALAVVVLALLAAGCDSQGDASTAQQPTKAQGPYTIVTTVAMVTDIVKQVAGDNANVIGLLGEGVDPHLHDPTRNDVAELMKADVIFYSGLHLEGRMQDTFESLAGKGKRVYAVTDGIDKNYLRKPAEFEGYYDPHVWMDAVAWSNCVAYVAQSLGEYDPAHADDYKKNGEACRAQLKALDDYARQVIASIPADQRMLVTAHDAFGYFSRAYNIPVHSPQGISTESEAGVDDINQLVDLLVERKLAAIFVESTVNPKTLQAVIEGAAKRGHKVAIGGKLFSDAMGAPGTYEGTYIGMIDHNATVIARGLGGTAPEKGMNGKLSSASP
jgi:manganese/zinc/iron transport system substrate-binding protein